MKLGATRRKTILVITAVLFAAIISLIAVSSLHAQLPSPPSPPDPFSPTGNQQPSVEAGPHTVIPTLSEWGMIVFSILLGGVAVMRMRKSQPAAATAKAETPHCGRLDGGSF